MFKHDYYHLHYIEFYNKLYMVKGDYKEILRLRNLALYGKITAYNKEEVRRGRKLLTDKQKKLLKIQNEENTQKLHDRLMEANEKMYLEYLEERRTAHGNNK